MFQYRKGFNRTGEQCKTRIHTLKIRYNRAKKFGLSGPEAEKECPFYRQLDVSSFIVSNTVLTYIVSSMVSNILVFIF